jgi:hypothetical protein
MSWLTANYGFWEFWAPYDPANGYYGEQKCIFDGVNKLIYVNPNVSSISVKEDIYSNWKEWVQVRDNSKFPPAIRVTGGDPIGGGAFTGDVYFMINGWRLYIDHSLNIDGVIYSDNYPSPFVQQENTQIVTNKVSSLVSVVATETVGGITVPTVQQIRQEMDANSSKLTAIKTKTDVIATSSQIASAVRTELTEELDHVLTLQNGQGLSGSQATMLLEIYRLYGLDPTRPLIVTKTARTAGDGISQNIISDDNQTIVARV